MRQVLIKFKEEINGLPTKTVTSHWYKVALVSLYYFCRNIDWRFSSSSIIELSRVTSHNLHLSGNLGNWLSTGTDKLNILQQQLPHGVTKPGNWSWKTHGHCHWGSHLNDQSLSARMVREVSTSFSSLSQMVSSNFLRTADLTLGDIWSISSSSPRAYWRAKPSLVFLYNA